MPTTSFPLGSPAPLPTATVPRRLNRRLLVVGSVVGLHVFAVWALQSGLLRRAVEMVIPVEVMAELIELPQPQVEPEPPAPAPPAPKPPPPKPRPAPPPPRPLPVATPSPEPSPIQAAPPEPVVPAPPAPVVAAPPPPAPPAPPAPPPVVQLPSSSADYLNNPRPPYPSLSRRLGEQGKVVVRVFIDLNGTASKAEIHTSSGYERLDQTALQTVLRWRYVPGKRGGVAEAMWFNVPINFVLE
jgi:protein TonB